MFSSLYAKLGIGLAALIIIGLFAWQLKAMVDKIDRQGQTIAHLETALKTEQEARKADVAGLTTFSRGVVAASSARALDDKILSETINVQNPQPVSPGLSNFLDGLRASDAHRPAASPASSAHGPTPAGASRTVH